MTAPLTLFEKVWRSHEVVPETPDQWGWLDHVDMAAPPAAAAR